MNNIKLNIKYKLINNGNSTQNLIMETYQNNLLISEIDVGDIEDIVSFKKEKQDLIKYLESKLKELECDDVDDEELKGYLIQKRYDYKEILERVKAGNYE